VGPPEGVEEAEVGPPEVAEEAEVGLLEAAGEQTSIRSQSGKRGL